MGKKDKKKKDPEKRAELQFKKEQKAEKAARKRLNKELARSSSNVGGGGGENQQQDAAGGGGGGEPDDIDNLLSSYMKKNLEVASASVEPLVGGDGKGCFPSPRANFSLTLLPTNEMLMYGGEYYDGAENIVYDDLFKWDPDARPAANKEETNEHSDKDAADTTTDAAANAEPHGEWKRIVTPVPRPPARCAHSAVLYRDAVYVLGGELATSDQFHHYRDFWRFNVKDSTWEEIRPRSGGQSTPSPRSGHRCVVWRHYMIVFGGFYEALRETRWYNDLHVYDFATNTWTEMTYSKLASIPPPRSGFAFGLHPAADTAYVYGGFSKVKNPGDRAEGKVHTDCWALHLKGIPQGKVPTWERLSRKGEYPSQRCSSSCAVYKQRMLVYGGVQDEEQYNHRVSSVFYNDLFALDMEKKRWFTLRLKKASAKGRRRKKAAGGEGDDGRDEVDEVKPAVEEDSSSEEEEEKKEGEAESCGWDLDKLRSNMFAFIDGDGNIVYEKIEPEDGEEDGYQANEGEKVSEADMEDDEQKDKRKDEEKEELKNDREDGTEAEALQSLMKPAFIPPGGIGDSEVMKVNSDGVPVAIERTVPLPRIKAAMVVRGNALYLYGGLLEVGDREVTLDDCWTIDLQKREKWVCIHKGSMHHQVWRGVESDNESYVSTDRGNDADSDEEDAGDEECIIPADEGGSAEDRKKASKREKKKEKSGIRAEIEQLKNQLNLDDVDRTPQLGEVMADFYARTSEYWNQQAITSVFAASQEQHSEKELKRIGFGLARERYEELRPLLERLNDLDEQQRAAESGKKERKEKKKKKSDKGSKERRKDRNK